MTTQAPVYSPDQLVYASASRCRCGAGLAYVKDRRPADAWNCSYLLTTNIGMRYKGEPTSNPFTVDVLEDANLVEHDGARAFAFWEIKSELQPSSAGITTRIA